MKEKIRQLATDVVRHNIRCQDASDEHANNQNRNDHS
jgi:hypothetical protein